MVNVFYNKSRHSGRNQDLIAYINRLCNCYSYSYTGNTAATILTKDIITPFVPPNVPGAEVQQGNDWVHSINNNCDEWLYNGETGLHEVTFTFELINGNTGGISSGDVFIYEDGIQQVGWEIKMPVIKGDSSTSLTGTIFLPMINSKTYSLHLRNNDNNDDIIVSNLRVTARPIPAFYPE